MTNQTLRKIYKGKEIVITGGLGLIGSTIAHRLVALGAKITILDAELPRYGGNHFNIESIKKSVSFVKGDIRDKAVLDYLVMSKDIIFNLAAQVDYNYSQEDPFLDLDINCRGHLTLLESCRKFNKNIKIVFAGSRMEYGKILQNPVNENHPTNPLSIYGVHKLTAEKYHQAYFNHYGIRCVCFRITNPYGPRSQMKHPYYSILNWFIRQAMEGKDITVFGDGQQIRDYVFVEDIAEAMIIAAVSDKTDGQVYNVGSGRQTRFMDMVKMIVDVVGKGRMVKKEWPTSWQNVETGDVYADISKLKKDIDWEPRTSLKEGVRKTVDYYKKNKNNYW